MRCSYATTKHFHTLQKFSISSILKSCFGTLHAVSSTKETRHVAWRNLCAAVLVVMDQDSLKDAISVNSNNYNGELLQMKRQYNIKFLHDHIKQKPS